METINTETDFGQTEKQKQHHYLEIHRTLHYPLSEIISTNIL